MQHPVRPNIVSISNLILLGIGIILAVTTYRMYRDGNRHYEQAEHLLEIGDRPGAVDHLESAAKSYVPGSPYVGRSLRELAIIAKAAEMRGDREMALSTWEVTRRSILSTRHLFQPNTRQLVESEQYLLRLRKDPTSKSPSRRSSNGPRIHLLCYQSFFFVGLAFWIGGTLATAALDTTTPGLRKRFTVMLTLVGLCVWILTAWLIE